MLTFGFNTVDQTCWLSASQRNSRPMSFTQRTIWAILVLCLQKRNENLAQSESPHAADFQFPFPRFQPLNGSRIVQWKAAMTATRLDHLTPT